MDTVRARVLDVAYERDGQRPGWPVVSLHGFPYDPRCYDDVVASLTRVGADVVVPYLRGYGATRFVSADTPRSGQQAALAHDLVELLDVLGLDRPIVGGFDYLHSERERNGLRAHRAEFARLLWAQWSPRWRFTDAQFAATASPFDNPDFVDVVVHSYRHRYGLVDSDPTYQQTEQLIATQPMITVPTVVLDAEHDGLGPPESRAEHETHFSNLIGRRLVDAGHDLPQENPAAFADAVLFLHAEPAA